MDIHYRRRPRRLFDGTLVGTCPPINSFAWNLPRSINKVLLYEEDYCVVIRKGHPKAGPKMSLCAYVGGENLIVSPSGDLSGIVDTELQKKGKYRRVAMSVPQFLPALSIVALTDLIATMPSRLVTKQSDRYGLTTAHPPIEIRSFPVSAFFYERDAKNPMCTWVISSPVNVSNLDR